MAVDVRSILCSLPPVDRLTKCDQLLTDAGLTVEERSEVWYFKVFTLRELHRITEALRETDAAVADGATGTSLGDLLVSKAIGLCDLGRFNEVDGVVEQAFAAPLTAVARAYLQVTQASALSRKDDPAAFETLQMAVAALATMGMVEAESWACFIGASLALKAGLHEEALRWAERIVHGTYVAAGRLLAAESYHQQGNLDLMANLLCQVKAHDYGVLAPKDVARLHYVDALAAVSRRDRLGAGAHITKALKVLASLESRESDLEDAVSRLRSQLRRGEVA